MMKFTPPFKKRYIASVGFASLMLSVGFAPALEAQSQPPSQAMKQSAPKPKPQPTSGQTSGDSAGELIPVLVPILAPILAPDPTTNLPPAKSSNVAVLCGWETTDFQAASADGKGMRYGKFRRVANQESGKDRPGASVNSECDSAIGDIAKSIGSTAGWYRQRKETTWADRGANSDPVAVYFGIFDLISCMADGRVYEVNFDGKNIKIKDVESDWEGAIRYMPVSKNRCS